MIFVHVGIVPDDEFLSAYRAYYEDSRLDKSRNMLVDLRRTESTVRSSAALKAFADIAKANTPSVVPPQKIAVIAPAALSFGLARMYEAFSDTVPAVFTVFRAADAALAWLGAPEDLLEEFEGSGRPADVDAAGSSAGETT